MEVLNDKVLRKPFIGPGACISELVTACCLLSVSLYFCLSAAAVPCPFIN